MKNSKCKLINVEKKLFYVKACPCLDNTVPASHSKTHENPTEGRSLVGGGYFKEEAGWVIRTSFHGKWARC